MVSFAIRDVYDPIFKGKVELVVRDHIKELDSKTIENLLFYLTRAGESHNADILGKICTRIEENEWVV